MQGLRAPWRAARAAFQRLANPFVAMPAWERVCRLSRWTRGIMAFLVQGQTDPPSSALASRVLVLVVVLVLVLVLILHQYCTFRHPNCVASSGQSLKAMQS